jgi:uncharacterized protein with GYD domain
MQTFIILSRFNEGGPTDPAAFPQTAASVKERIAGECPQVNWRDSYALMGAWDVLDLVESDSPEAVEKAAMIIRSHGNARTQTMLATPWKQFVEAMGPPA